MDFNSWINSLREVLQDQGAPLTLRNGHWEVIDRKEFWGVSASRIFDAHIDIFKNCAVDVLKEIDPQFELPAEERYAASIHGKVLKHSSDLRKGLAETLALLGNFGDRTKCSKNKPEDTAIFVIRNIFTGADCRLWGSLNDLLPTLAEAAPGEFLNAVEDALRKTPSPFNELFAQEGNSITGRNYMTGLLWALESLSWDEEYLVRVSVILAELASHDPGGNWANRPVNSLGTILLPWYPQTLASIDKRINSIKAIRRDFPNVVWKVLLTLLPNQHQNSFGTYKPRWRKIISENWNPQVTDKEYWEQVTGYAELAVEMACEDLDRLNELVGNLDNLPKASFDAILEYLSSPAITGRSEVERLPIWENLMDFVSKHRRFADEKWALGAETLSRIETTANGLSPVSPEGLHRRLFSNRDFDLYEKTGEYEEQRKKLDEQRQQAILEILNTGGLQGVIAFVDVVEAPNQVGWALGIVAASDIDINLLPEYLDIKNIKYKNFIRNFVWIRHHRKGWQWVDGLNRSSWSLMQTCQILMYLPFGVNTWRRVSEWLGDYEKRYWENVQVNPNESNNDNLHAIDKLLEVARPWAAINCLHDRLHKKLPLDKKRTVKALLDAVSSKESLSTMDSYYAIDLIKALQNDSKTDQNDLFKVEWAYLPLLYRYHGDKPKLLEKRLAAQPEFFCDVIRRIYRSKNEEKQDKEPDEQKKANAANAYQLLREWRHPPGLQEDGTFSDENFETWLKSVKEEFTKTGYFEVAMLKVGGVLLHCPADPQGLWIMRSAANALNARDAEDMRRGFSTAVFNSRGVHMVDPTGKPERDLADLWRKRANAVEDAGFTRFAAILKELSDSYNRDAERIIEEEKHEKIS